MNYCPECGSTVDFERLQTDVPTNHYYYTCLRGGHRWEETLDKSGEVLHIALITEEQEEGGE